MFSRRSGLAQTESRRNETRRRRRVAAALLAATAESMLCAQRACATVHTFTGGTGGFSGAWSLNGNWNPSGVPGANDTAIIAFVSSVQDTNVTYDYAGSPITLSVLRVSRSNSGPGLVFGANLNMTSNHALTVNDEYIGDSTTGGTKGRGTVNQSAGTNTTPFLMLGNGTTDIGNYSLSGTGVLRADTIDLGIEGTGNYTQSGGLAVCSRLMLGLLFATTGNGTMSGGQLTADGTILIGSEGNGNFNQSGGTIAPDIGSMTTVTLGDVAGSNGTYNLSGGTLSATTLNVGSFGIGTFLQSAGSVNLNAFGATPALLRVGGFNAGNYSVGNTGAVTVSGGSEIIGDQFNGTFTQSGGSNSVSFGTFTNQAGLTLGNGSFANGSYTLSGGTLSVTRGNEVIGGSGVGNFTQTGGTNTMTSGNLLLGQSAGSTGSYTISAGSLTADFIGVGLSHGGLGVFSQNGGTVTCQTLGIANNTNDARGTYTLNAGSLTLGSGTQTTASMYVSAGVGTFTQYGGTVSPGTNVTMGLYIGSELGANGGYILNDGTLSIPFGNESIGDTGSGSFTQNGGTNSISYSTPTPNGMFLGTGTFARGTYTLTAGSLTLTNCAQYIGYVGIGTFVQTGGSNSITNNATNGLILGDAASSNGTYNLTAGSLNVSNGLELIGNNGAGTFIQSGGTHTIGAGLITNDKLLVGFGTLSRGNYNLSAGALAVAFNEYVGYNGAGTFVQSAGAHTIGNNLFVSTLAGASGSYTLSGGTLSVGGTEYVGFNSNGTFFQSGGIHTILGSPGILAVGAGTGTSGSYTLDAGTLSAKNIYVGGDNTGAGGNGTFKLNTVNTLTVSGAMTIDSTGTLAGNGATNAFIISNGGAISPGNGGAGTLGVGPLVLGAGSRLYFEPGDLLDSSNSLNITGATRIELNGPFTVPTPIITYKTQPLGASNLSVAGNTVGLTYTARADFYGLDIVAVPTRVANTTQISVNGQLGPIGQSFIAGVSPGAVNDSGTVSFSATLSSGNYGPVLFDGRSYTVIALTAQPAPGAGAGNFNGTLNYFDNVNSAGQTVFLSFLSNTTDGSTEGCFRGNASSVVAIYRDKQVLPNGGGTITGWFSAPVVNSINNAGQVPVLVGLSGASDGAASEIFIGDGNSLTPIARNKQAVPGAGGGVFDVAFGPFAGSHTDPIINNAGQVAFHATLTGTSDGSTAGVFRGDANSIIAIARTGQTSPGSGGGTFSGFGFGLALDDSGQVAFQSNLGGASDGANSALYRGDGISTVVIARDKQSAPGAGGGSFGGTGFFGFGNSFAMSASGQVAFQVNLSGTTDGSTSGIFRGDGNSIVAIARQKQIAPNTAGATISGFGNTGLTIAPGGQVAFNATLAGTIDGNAGTALLVGDGQDLIPIAITGQTIATTQGNRTIGGTIRFGSFNSYGQLPWSTVFSGGGFDTGNFLFTPVLHWRAPGSGNWDTSNNWTLGLAPAYVHDVVVDPTNDLTITGPSSNTTIRSFTVGTVGSGAATVHLAGGNLHVTGPLSITSASKLDLDTSSLVYGYSGAVLPLDLIRDNLILGYAGGTWLGGGITSTHAATIAADHSNIHKTALGYATAGAIGGNTFAGFTVAPSDVLVKYTLAGDSNLDGAVNTLDFNVLAGLFNNHGTLWFQGDFNFDGVTNALDFNALATNFGATLSSDPLGSLVPEPALMTLPLFLLLRRRKARL